MKKECICIYTHDYPGSDKKNVKVEAKAEAKAKVKVKKKDDFNFSAFLKSSWWKILGILILVYVIIGGLLFPVPEIPVIRETIRNIYFHVGMWFAMIFILFLGMINSIIFLRTGKRKNDQKALAMAYSGLLFGFLGLITGMIWANNTWGAFWLNDPKLNGAAIGVLVYLAYLVLRSSIDDSDKRARLAAVYNVFAFVMFFIFIMVIPRMSASSIHPGIDGNPALATGDLDASMRKVFWPAVLGWIIFSYWIAEIFYKTKNIQSRIEDIEME
ncbi:MAG: cytochrome c biogenesis protein [Bacteroidota bacterium]